MSQYLSKAQFKVLLDEWYQKLADDGFVDIEETRKNQMPFDNQPHSKAGKSQNQFSPTWIQSKAEYYHLATQFLTEHEFETDLERTIWTYHTNAVSVRDIAEILEQAKLETHYISVWRTVNALRNIMKAKYNVNPK